jgi:hypothetical protein
MRQVMRSALVFFPAVFGVLVMSGTEMAVAQAEPLKIGIIGTGRIGGALARHWVGAGHEVFMSSRHPEELESLAEELGPMAHAGTPREAAAFGEVVLVSVPYAAIPQIGRDYADELAGKTILDTSNPFEGRDAGFDPVVIGSLEESRQFDLGQPLARGSVTAAELRRAQASLD